MQIYSKEKIKAKKKKVDKQANNAALLKSILNKMKYTGFLNASTRDSERELELAYISLCKKYGYEEHINKDKATLTTELEFFNQNEINEKLKKQKKKSKILNSEIVANALTEATTRYNYRDSNPVSQDPHQIRAMFFKNGQHEPIIATRGVEVFSLLNKFKKLFSPNNVKNPYIFTALAFIARNSALWIQRDFEFTPKSKNIEKTVLDLFNYYFFEYPIQKNEMFLCEYEPAMQTFINTKSMKKTIDKNFEKVGLTKKQINKVKNYKMLVDHKSFNDFLFEIKFNDIVQDNFITKEMIFKNDKEFLIEYAYYISNVILKDPMFSKVQIAPLFDYAVRKNNEYRIEGKVFTFKNRCLINLFNEMEDWHRTLFVSKSKRNISWDKSINVIERVYETFKDKDKDINELKLPNNYSFHRVVELNSSTELKSEGRALRHCVGSYDKTCANGNMSIFSLRFKGYGSVIEKSLVTIQVDKDERVTQARGFSNRLPTAKERNLIKNWANENRISY